ncbi:unnamed protein product [Gadus morhua 'NCC']
MKSTSERRDTLTQTAAGRPRPDSLMGVEVRQTWSADYDNRMRCGRSASSPQQTSGAVQYKPTEESMQSREAPACTRVLLGTRTSACSLVDRRRAGRSTPWPAGERCSWCIEGSCGRLQRLTASSACLLLRPAVGAPTEGLRPDVSCRGLCPSPLTWWSLARVSSDVSGPRSLPEVSDRRSLAESLAEVLRPESLAASLCPRSPARGLWPEVSAGCLLTRLSPAARWAASTALASFSRDCIRAAATRLYRSRLLVGACVPRDVLQLQTQAAPWRPCSSSIRVHSTWRYHRWGDCGRMLYALCTALVLYRYSKYG